MQSTDTTPRFRNLSINGMPPMNYSSFSFNDTDTKVSERSENGCFMCRQANVYLNPIGMQRERRVARHQPPPLSRAKIEELSEKKHLTKREARLLLQCYFPEIKNVKYFQLHKFHSCCYDPKHMNLCKNHITALQHERVDDGHHALHKHKDADHFKEYEREDGYQNRVSFVRIKIEPTKGIPTRFLGPTALPESLADMLIKQVNRYENKKRPTTFNSHSHGSPSMYNLRRVDESTGEHISTASEYLGTLGSDEDDDEEMTSDEDEFEEETRHPNTAISSSIYGYNGKSRDHPRVRHNSKLRSISEKTSSKPVSSSNGDLIVEDVEELEPLFVHDGVQSSTKGGGQSSTTKKRRRRARRVKKPGHTKPKLNHWEELALAQAKQEPCGCRHHVRRLEANQLVYDWCRCKDHLHKEIKAKSKPAPKEHPPTPPPPPPPLPPAEKPKPEKKKTESKNKNELALAYDPTAVDYDVIQEVLYFRTASGRLVKPEISNSFAYNDALKARGVKLKKTTIKEDTESVSSKATSRDTRRTPKKYFLSVGNSPIPIPGQDPASNNKTFPNGEFTMTRSGLLSLQEYPESPIMRTRASFGNKENVEVEPVKTEEYKPPVPVSIPAPEVEEVSEIEEEESDEENEVLHDFIAPGYLPQNPNAPASPTATLPMGMQKSSKPTFKNHHPTPNVERESSLLAERRWYDQALGDQNLLTVHDGQFGLIAGASTEEYVAQHRLPDYGYTEAVVDDDDDDEEEKVPVTRGACTIS